MCLLRNRRRPGEHVTLVAPSEGPAIDANANESAPERLVCLMLWVDEEGWLSSLEVVDVADDHGAFDPIPPPSMYEPPKVQQ